MAGHADGRQAPRDEVVHLEQREPAPGRVSVIDAIVGKFPRRRATFNATQKEGPDCALAQFNARNEHRARSGSGESDPPCARSRRRQAAGHGRPSFENPRDTAKRIGSRARSGFDGKLRIDIENGRGVEAPAVFFCNPNNPTATVRKTAVIDMVRASGQPRPAPLLPLLDYVTDGLPVAIDVARPRTCSSPAPSPGLRHGRTARRLSHAPTIKAVTAYKMPCSAP
jgi:hypothetical protein